LKRFNSMNWKKFVQSLPSKEHFILQEYTIYKWYPKIRFRNYYYKLCYIIFFDKKTC